jgi:murein L,D-transpeptidase YafK
MKGKKAEGSTDMWMIRAGLAALLLAALAACSGGPRFLTYHGPEVTRVIVEKEARRMHLMHHDQVLKSYRVQLGGNPNGHKQQKGDSRTPEGEYIIDRRNPRSSFHLSLGISYPNEYDVEFAATRGVSPGGDIFIHGRGPNHRRSRGDWTEGCIAVNDHEIEVIYSMVRDGTPITILR